MTPHNEAKLEDIAKTVIMAGDPLRVKNLAVKYLENYRLVNSIRGMYAYTGTYKGAEVTIMAHGMGMPSAGIYVYELFKFYNVENIIRIGTCGAYSKDLNLLDIIIVDKSYTESNYAYTLNNQHINIAVSSNELNEKLKNSARNLNIKIKKENILTSDCFDWYVSELEKSLERIPNYINVSGVEMESFAIFYIASIFKRKASCLLTVVDSHHRSEDVSAELREKSLDDMALIAFNSIL